jgi:hypothetical protein
MTDETGTPGHLVFSISPALTGFPTAPTQTTSDTSTDIATDGFVNANLVVAFPNLASTGLYGGTGAAGVAAAFTEAANTILGNATSGIAAPTALALGSCSTSASALLYTTNSGFSCNTAINAAQLAGATWASPPATGYGSSTPEPVAATTVAATSLSFANLADSKTAPTISAGCGGGSPSISAPNGTDAFVVTIGTASGASCAVAMPTATTGWVCFANDLTTHTTANSTVMQTASSASSVTVTGYSDITGAATWVSGDKIAFLCRAY